MRRGLFHRIRLVERCGCGTNRVAERCLAAAIPAPRFEEIGSAAPVTFKVRVGATGADTPQVTPQVERVLRAARNPQTRGGLQEVAGIKDREHFRLAYLARLLAAGSIEMTVPALPDYRSRVESARFYARRTVGTHVCADPRGDTEHITNCDLSWNEARPKDEIVAATMKPAVLYAAHK
jgi:hypothetical protein